MRKFKESETLIQLCVLVLLKNSKKLKEKEKVGNVTMHKMLRHVLKKCQNTVVVLWL